MVRATPAHAGLGLIPVDNALGRPFTTTGVAVDDVTWPAVIHPVPLHVSTTK